MRSFCFTSLVVAATLLAVGGCRGPLTTPNEPPPTVAQKELVDNNANQLFAQSTAAGPRWPGASEWTESETAVDTLGRIGPSALPALVELLHGQDEGLQIGAARAIALMGPKAKDAVPDLVAALADPSSRVRKYVLRALGQMGDAAGSAVEAVAREARRAASPLDLEIERERQPRQLGPKTPRPPTSSPPAYAPDAP
jgi:hypothetical protein